MADSVGTVEALWRYPVKSMQGEQLDASAVGERGLAGDRQWAVIDAETGKVASAKRPKLWLTLLECRAAYVEEPTSDGAATAIAITLPDGDEIRSDDPGCERRLSEALGRPVTLACWAPEGATYELREADMRGLDVPEPERLTESPVAIFAPPGTFFDTSTLHVITTRSLEQFAEAHPEGRWDPRRFRPNVLVAGDGAGSDGFVENAWVGRALALGEDAQAAVLAPMPRCVMTTVAQGDLERDPLILRTVAEQNRQELEGFGAYACAGVLANVTGAGTVSVGDAVALGDPVEAPA